MVGLSLYSPIAEHSINILLLVGLGGAVGFFSGLCGVGGGFLMTPLLTMIGIPQPLRRPLTPTRWWLRPLPAHTPIPAWAVWISKWDWFSLPGAFWAAAWGFAWWKS